MHPFTNSVLLKEQLYSKKREKASEVYTKCHKVERRSAQADTEKKSSRRVSDGGAQQKRRT